MVIHPVGTKIQYTGRTMRDLTEGSVYQVARVDTEDKVYVIFDDVDEANFINFRDASLVSTPLNITVSVKGENLDFQSNLEFTDKESLQKYLSKVFF